MTKEEILVFLQSHSNSGSALGLSRVELLFDYLGHPQRKLPIVHVAGTNGKGSTIAFLSSILEEAGYKVGRFQSPWVFSYEEQIRLGEIPILEQDFISVGTKVINAAQQMVKDGWEMPTEFEMLFPMACLYFLEKDCQIVLVEVGLGGEGDATNVIPTPLLSVITKITYDHMNYLGDTLEEIAKAKAGIIKKGGAVLLQKQKDVVMPVFLNKIKEVEGTLVPLYELPDSGEIQKESDEKGKSSATVTGKDDTVIFDWNELLGLKGVYQIENASLAYSAALALKDMGYDISDEAIISGLKHVKWPGRFEILSQDPLLIIDGAHNEDGAKALAKSLNCLYNKRKFQLVIGILGDKEYEKMLEELLPFATKVFCVTPQNPRALSAEDLAEVIKKKNPALPVAPCNSVEEALQLSYFAGKRDTVAFGSLYYIGEIRKRFFESRTN